MPQSGTQRPNCWNAAGVTETGYCSNAIWDHTVTVSDIAGLVGKEVKKRTNRE